MKGWACEKFSAENLFVGKSRPRHNAKRRELFLKGGKGHAELKIQLQDIFKKINYIFR